MLPAARFPGITGTRVRARPMESGGWPDWGGSIIPMGMRYMLAIECSNPAATNAAIGSTIATHLSTTLRPASDTHTAVHTSTLHMTPLANAVSGGSEVLAAAIRR